MKLRADHVAGAAFIGLGLLIIALSGELPTGQLSMPGSGFMPKIVAVLTMIFGLALIVRAGESPPFSEVSWSDGKHAILVTAATAAAIALYTYLGFMLTMGLMMTAVLVLIERRNPIHAIAYSAAIVLITYSGFVYLLKTPMPDGPFGF
jgi:hypothetical protein